MRKSHQLAPIGHPSLLRRLAAMFYDFILALALSLAVTAVILAIRVAIDGAEQVRAGGRALQGGYSVAVLISVLIAQLLFFAYFWSRNGQTLGMQAWRIRIDSPDNQAIAFKTACLRWLLAWVSAAVCGLGYLWALFDGDKRTWHDIWSNTQTVLLPKKSRGSDRAS